MGAKEVAAGAEWLDDNFPGWEREIDLGILNMNDCQKCVCGQSLRKYVTLHLNTGYDIALAAAVGMGENRYHNRSWWGDWAEDHGFNPRNSLDAAEAEELWRDLIKERFSTGNLSDV